MWIITSIPYIGYIDILIIYFEASFSKRIALSYDDLGRIVTVDNGKVIKYYCDSLGQVVREDNGELNKTITYTYN